MRVIIKRQSQKELTFAVVTAEFTGEQSVSAFKNAVSTALGNWMSNTPKGKIAWEVSCGDFNIGDLSDYNVQKGSELYPFLIDQGVDKLVIDVASFHDVEQLLVWSYDDVLGSVDDE